MRKMSTPAEEKTGSSVGPPVSWGPQSHGCAVQKAAAGVDAGTADRPGGMLASCTISNTPESFSSSECFY